MSKKLVASDIGIHERSRRNEKCHRINHQYCGNFNFRNSVVEIKFHN